FGEWECQTTAELTSFGNPRVRRVQRPRSEWVEIPCPPIVDEELFYACRRQLELNREQLRGRPTRIWLLHGVVMCAVCRAYDGKPLHCNGHTRTIRGHEQRRYACNSGW